MLRSISFAVLLVALLATALPLHAQQTVAYVDVNSVITESRRGQALMQQLRNEFMKPLDDLKKEEGQLVELRVQLSQPVSGVTDVAMQTMLKDLDERQLQYKRRTEDLERDVQLRRTELFNLLEVELLDLIEVVRAEKKIGIVFSQHASGFLAIDPALDLTQEVMARLDRSR